MREEEEREVSIQRTLTSMSPQEGTVSMAVAAASPDFSLLNFIADSQALVMLFSNGTVQVSDQNGRL